MDKNKFLEKIRSNIEAYGQHITLVQGAKNPRYAYTIGLSQELGFELVFAGGYYYDKDAVSFIMNSAASMMKQSRLPNQSICLDPLGTFTLVPVHPSWSALLLLGVFDYLKICEVQAFQIMPDRKHFTLETPDTSQEYDPEKHLVWKWLQENWNLPVTENSTVTTNILALQGANVTEVARWEAGDWEMFAGSSLEVLEEDIRIVPIWTMIGIDSTLKLALDLEIGKALWREPDSKIWNQWN